MAANETALKENNKKFESFMYEGTQLRFHDETTALYDDVAPKLARARTLDYFWKYLK